MGYRHRLGRIDKKDRTKYVGKTASEVSDMLNPENNWAAHPPEHEQLYELGKYVEFTTDEISEFYSFDCLEECESEFHILTKKGLQHLIEWYAEGIGKYYDKLAEGTEKELKAHVLGMKMEWVDALKYGGRPYYLDQEHTDGEIVSSWKSEYAIFNLVYIYRTFNWENDFLIYSAW